jgi:hypothetical protein
MRTLCFVLVWLVTAAVAAHAEAVSNEPLAVGLIMAESFIDAWSAPLAAPAILAGEIVAIAGVSTESRNAIAATQPPLRAVGALTLGGQSVVTQFQPRDVVLWLRFAFVDPASGMTMPGPEVSYVQYQWDPQASSTFTLSDMVPLAVSYDAADNFAIPFQPPVSSTLPPPFGAESLITATPYDSAGNVISIPDSNGENVAVAWLANIEGRQVPEPATFVLVFSGLGVMGLLMGGWWRRRTGP